MKDIIWHNSFVPFFIQKKAVAESYDSNRAIKSKKKESFLLDLNTYLIYVNKQNESHNVNDYFLSTKNQEFYEH